MPDKIHIDEQTFLNEDNDLGAIETPASGLSRRQVLAGSTGAVAAASAAATAAVLTPTAAEAKWPTGSKVSDPSMVAPEAYDSRK